jgi:hypothetical protein
VAAWRTAARARLKELLLAPDSGGVPQAAMQHQFPYDGLDVEHLSWQLPYGPPSEALLLKPAGAKGPLPAVLALHDHGGNKYFGTRKITRISDERHPLIVQHQDRYYGGVAWANELAKRGYVVLVHDTFLFASRRIRAGDLPKIIKGDLQEVQPESEQEIAAYNRFASGHEHLWPRACSVPARRGPASSLARTSASTILLKAGGRWPSAAAGVSGGAADNVSDGPRRAIAAPRGRMMTTARLPTNKCFTHTWMIYIPGLARDLDYPEIVGLAAPKPVLVLNCNQDALFTVPEMQRADRMLTEVYEKAGGPDRYRARLYEGGHKFDLPMKAEAFAWFDKWLSPGS